MKQRQGHRLHRICAYQGSFPPQLVSYFLDRYPGQVVMDPFAGRGTVLLEVTLRGRTALGFDLLPLASVLSSVKLGCPTQTAVLSEIDSLDLSRPAPPVPENFADLYHTSTWRELWNLRGARKSAALTALALGRLHGHSPGFFSAFTFNVVSIPPASLKRQRQKHLAKGTKGAELEYRDVKAILCKAAHRFIPLDGHSGIGCAGIADARELPVASSTVDLVVTSPPFLDVIDYPDVNWVRQWFLGAGTASGEPFSHKDRYRYRQFLRDVMRELHRVVRPDGIVVFEVGPIKRHVSLCDEAVKASAGYFGLVEVLNNDFGAVDGKSVPKISRAMRSSAKAGAETTTTANQCVVLRCVKTVSAMKLLDVFWTPEVNVVRVQCRCQAVFKARLDRWKVRCQFCGLEEDIDAVRSQSIPVDKAGLWEPF